MTVWERIWLLLSQAVNALRYGGHPDESLSARAWRERSQPQWERRRSRIDRFLGVNHCKDVHEEQIKREDARRG
jgi:hypothetical protein